MKPAQKIFLLLVPLVASGIFAACTPIASVAITNNYQGYPCGANCQQFQSGFETAQTLQFNSQAQCSSLASSEQVGCLSYLHEQSVNPTESSGYMF